MNKIIDFIKQNKYNTALITVWFLIALTAVLNHEMWRDETQAWCIVRDLNPAEIFNAVRIEGHPVLWYMVLFPFAKLGFNVFSMQVISFLFVFAAVIYFVFKSPFNKFIKTVVIFSAGLLYYLPAVARNYALIPLFLFILGDIFPKRKEHPYLYALLIVLLSNTHILMLGFCLILTLLFSAELITDSLKDKKIKKILPLLLPGINFLFLFLMFYNMNHLNHAVEFVSSHPQPFIAAVVNFAKLSFLFPFNLLGNINVLVFYILIIIIAISFLKNNRQMFLVFLGSFAYIFYVYHRIWFNGVIYQKIFLLLLIILFCCWVHLKENKNSIRMLMIALGILYSISMISSVLEVVLEIKYPFSGAKQAAEYIKNNLDEEQTFYAVGYPFLFTSISAYLPDKKLYSYINNYYISYYDFSKSSQAVLEEDAKSKYYIVSSNFILDDRYEEIFASDEVVINQTEYNEIFKIFKEK